MNNQYFKRLATAASLFLVVLFVHGQTFNVVHYNQTGGGAFGSSVRETPTGFLVFGIQTAQNFGPQDFTTTYFDINGNYQNDIFYAWQTIDILGLADPVASIEGSDEYIAGICKRISGPNVDSLIAMKINNSGDSIWTKSILTKPNIEFSKCLVKDTSYYFIGGQNEDLDTPPVTFVIRTDTLANVNLYHTISIMAAYSIDVDSAANIYIAGAGSNKGFLHKIYSNGGDSWIAVQNKPRGLWYGVKRMFGDKLLCMGSWNESSPLPGTPDINTMHLAMYSLNGSLDWDFEGLRSKPFGSNFGSFTDGFQDTDTTFIACGAIQQLYYNRAVIYRMTQDGDSLWRREYAHFGNLSNLYPEIPWDIEPTSDGGMVLTGETWDQDTVPPYSDVNMWLLKLDSLGCLVPGCQFVGIETISYGLDNTMKAWPNPSIGLFTLDLDLPADLRIEGNLRLQVFDALGRSVMDRDLGLLLKRSIALDLTDQPAGLYTAHLSDNLRILTGTRIVVQ